MYLEFFTQKFYTNLVSKNTLTRICFFYKIFDTSKRAIQLNIKHAKRKNIYKKINRNTKITVN